MFGPFARLGLSGRQRLWIQFGCYCLKRGCTRFDLLDCVLNSLAERTGITAPYMNMTV
jgi:hypothetical protein